MAIVGGPYMHGTSRRDILICWVTDNASVPNASNSQVRVGTNVNNLNMVFTNTNAVVANAPIRATDGISVYIHSVRVSGLQPNTQYFYNVGNVGVSNVGVNTRFFWTAPTIGSNVEDKRFWAQADAGVGGSDIENGFVTYNTNTGSPKVNGMLAIGDNAYDDGLWIEYRNVFLSTGAYGNQLNKYNLVACAGNHEYPSGSQNAVYTSRPYFNLFKFPLISETGGIPSFNLKYHSWDCGNVHFISLDGYNIENGVQSPSPNSPQYKWLVNHLKFIKNEISAGRKKWVVVIEHFPAFGDAGHETYGLNSPDAGEPGIEFRNVYIPLLHQYNVDLCLYGHDHNYYRTRLIHDYNGNGTTVPFNQVTHSWPPYQWSADPLGRTNPYNKITYSGTVHVVMGNGNLQSNQYTTHSLYGSIPNNLMVVSTAENNTIALNLPPCPNGANACYFKGSGVIDIKVGGGTSSPGSDRLTFRMIDDVGTVRDFFHIDK